MINAPIPSAQSPVKRPTRRQDPEAVPSGCFGPSKWASARSSADERNPESNPCSNPTTEGSSPNKRATSARSSVEDRNPSSIPSSATLSARSELTPAGTPYATPHGTPTKPGTASGTRNGAGISINELIRSAREGIPPPQVRVSGLGLGFCHMAGPELLQHSTCLPPCMLDELHQLKMRVECAASQCALCVAVAPATKLVPRRMMQKSMHATHSWRFLRFTAVEGNDLTQHCSGQLQHQAHCDYAFPQAARAVRHAVSHPSSPVAAAQAAATDRLPGYSIGKTIGEGGFCKVRMGVHDISGQQVAIKVIDKLKLKVSRFRVLQTASCLGFVVMVHKQLVDQCL